MARNSSRLMEPPCRKAFAALIGLQAWHGRCIRTALNPSSQLEMTELGIPVAPRGKRYYISDNNRGLLRD